MLTDISWAAYLAIIGTASLIWYITIGLLYYYTDIKTFLNGKRTMQINPIFNDSVTSNISAGENQNALQVKEPEPVYLQDFEIIEELVDRVKTVISEACEKKSSREDFFELLSKLLKDYPTLLNSEFRPSVNEFISAECLEQGFGEISIDEVEQKWHA
ncbi:hypothetical protein [Flavobacterium sp. fv08]|uniref:hypothetical protein n=1 Tax=Flavobacterium sp. fv08 TaxID=1761784 RepID=UPI0008CA8D2D|nr:hypothetical protein [Flavobacterium sp. fv08]SEP06738.1 hypothetical protein SAMN04487978_4371 [Flavobacterium sp. fv08]